MGTTKEIFQKVKSIFGGTESNVLLTGAMGVTLLFSFMMAGRWSVARPPPADSDEVITALQEKLRAESPPGSVRAIAMHETLKVNMNDGTEVSAEKVADDPDNFGCWYFDILRVDRRVESAGAALGKRVCQPGPE